MSFLVGLKASSEELEELKNLFLRLDTSRDGTLSIEEIKEGMETMAGNFGTHKVNEYKELMRTLDKDGNGVIDYTEFITGAIDKVALLNKKNLLSAFKMIDQDNSGLITVDELKAVFDTGGDKKDNSLWIEIMKEVDQNGDGQISYEEFTDAMTEILKKKHL